MSLVGRAVDQRHHGCLEKVGSGLDLCREDHPRFGPPPSTTHASLRSSHRAIPHDCPSQTRHAVPHDYPCHVVTYLAIRQSEPRDPSLATTRSTKYLASRLSTAVCLIQSDPCDFPNRRCHEAPHLSLRLAEPCSPRSSQALPKRPFAPSGGCQTGPRHA